MSAKKYLVLHTILIFITLNLSSTLAFADGKYLRNQKWKRFSVEESKADFFVASNGNDNWSGTLSAPNAKKNDGPFATIERAQRAVLQLKKHVYTTKEKVEDNRYMGSPYTFGNGKDILVLIRGGNYFLRAPLIFEADDGGERCETALPSGAFEFHKLKDFYITYAAYPGEIPLILGGQKISDWEKENGKWKASTKKVDVQKLIVNGAEQTLARTPNTGYFTPANMPAKITEFKFRKGDLREWPNLENSRIHLVLRWHKGVNSISKIDETNKIAYLKKPEKGLVYVPPRYYVENVEALLDAPGEWFFDNKNNQVSYIPEAEIENPNGANIIAPILKQLLIVKGKVDKPVRNLRFYGLTFNGSITGGNALSFEHAKNCELVDSEIRNVGGIGVLISNGCYQTKILKNKIINSESGGIAVRGNPHPENWNDVVRETVVSYNFVSECGGHSIGAHNSLYTTISHNEITNTRGRYAMNVGGWNNVEEALEGGYRVEYNHLHHVQNGADDSGAITSSGLTHDSLIRYNLIHDVYPGFFNDNVAFWFDNMSSGWTVEDNIYYNLKQGKMKLCACYLADNIYENNFLIETPVLAPEGIIEGTPEFEFSDLTLQHYLNNEKDNFSTGEHLIISANVKNTGSTGIGTVDFYVNKKILKTKKFPVIKNNVSKITFEHQFDQPGKHTVAIGNLPYLTVDIKGEPIDFLFSELKLSNSVMPVGNETTVGINVKNVRTSKINVPVNLFLNDTRVENNSIILYPKQTKNVEFKITPKPGIHKVNINQISQARLEVYPFHSVSFKQSDLATYCSGTAKPCSFEKNIPENKFQIIVHGTDFYHAEDSYGSIYLKKQISGNFVATVKVNKFGDNVTEWFRTGIFVRNDITKSYETEPGSVASVLMFTTPKRYGMQWDEYGDGCMHKASSKNYEKKISFVWLKLERHENTFSGFISFDGKKWTKYGETTQVPGLAELVHVGLAAGANNEASSMVGFEEFKLYVEDEGWK
jgi:hypothetical protein